ncbi:MAG TPA: CHAT domain-containing protein [Thermoanaerobaculia bacterium]
MSSIASHLDLCTSCDGQQERDLRRRRLLIVVALILIVILGVSWVVLRSRSTLDSLIDRVFAQGRAGESRISGRQWSPFQRNPSGVDPVKARLEAKLAAFLSDTTGPPEESERHSLAIGLLAVGRPEQAIEILTELAPLVSDAHIWSDLAAAYLDASARGNDPALLAKALSSADRALRLDSRSGAALFNRALALERLELHERTRAAWEQFLAVDGSSAWANEARGRIRRLGVVEPFRARLDREYDRLAADSTAVHELASAFPQEVRTWGETEILGRWAAAFSTGDAEEAVRHLTLARMMGESLVRNGGDGMLVAAVAAIDQADEARKRLLAEAHLAFREGQAANRASRAAAARPLFIRAAEQFDQGGSPVALISRYFAANTMYNAGEVVEAKARLEHLAATAPAELRAHRAQVEWQLARVHALEGKWGRAMEKAAASLATFEQLGETDFAATLRSIIVEIYERTGDPDAAWRERMVALRELGGRNSPRLMAATAALTRSALRNGEWAEAWSFLNLELEMTGPDSPPARRVELLLLRAQLNRRDEAVEEARRDLLAIRSEIGQLDDASMSAQLEARALAVEGMLAAEAGRSVELLTAAADAQRAQGRMVDLPEILLHRGLAYSRLGDRELAADDFEAGIVMLEASRESLPEGASRWGVFDADLDLFEEAIVHAVDRHDVEAGFAYAERARARQLVEAMGPTTAAQPTRVPAGVTLVEYVALERKLLLFTLDPGGVRVAEAPIGRAELSRRVARLSRAMQSGESESLREEAAGLYQVLITPVATALSASRTVVFVPDRTLEGVPFAVLQDRAGRFLIQKRNVVVSPSAAVYSRLANRPPARRAATKLLLVANPATVASGLRSLPAAELEAHRVSQLYPDRVALVRGEATVAAFRREAPLASVIHYAGHATAHGDGGTALLLSGERGKADAHAIASLRLEKSPLVVLAACETARGTVRKSEGSISVARAFLAAGARGVVATLQPLEDEAAAEFFTRFHLHLARGSTAAEALRAVQIEWIGRPDRPLAEWASVQLIGN